MSLILVSGLPGSGKSRLASDLYNTDRVTGTMRLDIDDYGEWDFDLNIFATNIDLLRTDVDNYLLENKHLAIFGISDNIDLVAKSFKFDYKYWIDVDLEVIASRLNKRSLTSGKGNWWFDNWNDTTIDVEWVKEHLKNKIAEKDELKYIIKSYDFIDEFVSNL